MVIHLHNKANSVLDSGLISLHSSATVLLFLYFCSVIFYTYTFYHAIQNKQKKKKATKTLGKQQRKYALSFGLGKSCGLSVVVTHLMLVYLEFPDGVFILQTLQVVQDGNVSLTTGRINFHFISELINIKIIYVIVHIKKILNCYGLP